MATRETVAQRGARRARYLLRRIGEELRSARFEAGTSSRDIARVVGVSHTQVLRIERGLAPHVDLDVLAKQASAVGCEIAVSIHPAGPPIRDAGHVALLGRLRGRISASLGWRTEVPIPIAGDPRSADAVIDADVFDAIVEAETRLADVQALERRIAAKQRDLGVKRVVLLVQDSRHNRRTIASTPGLQERFPVSTRACLAALSAGRDPGGDCLVVL